MPRTTRLRPSTTDTPTTRRSASPACASPLFLINSADTPSVTFAAARRLIKIDDSVARARSAVTSIGLSSVMASANDASTLTGSPFVTATSVMRFGVYPRLAINSE